MSTDFGGYMKSLTTAIRRVQALEMALQAARENMTETAREMAGIVTEKRKNASRQNGLRGGRPRKIRE